MYKPNVPQPISQGLKHNKKECVSRVMCRSRKILVDKKVKTKQEKYLLIAMDVNYKYVKIAL